MVTEEGVILFSDTPKGMKARNSYLQHLADGFFNVTKVPETLRIYEIDLPTKRVAGLADNCIEKLSKADLRSTDAQMRRSVVTSSRTEAYWTAVCAGRSSTCGPISITSTG